MNLYSLFRSLIPQYPTQVAKVLATTATGAFVELPGGAHITVKGTGDVGTNVFIKDGAIVSAAPDLTVGVQDV